MNKNLYRSQFAQMETTEKQALMESPAVRYTMTFFGLHTFDRWGQSCTTGIFEKDGREFVFVPGDTITLGWEQFAHGTESGEPGGIGVSVPGMGNGAGPGRTHWREHGSRPASGHRPHMLAGWAHFSVSCPVRPTVSRKCRRTMNETEIMTFIGLSSG